MLGGGYGDYRPGEWSDDTQMALCIAQVVADGVDISSDAGLDLIARNFLAWFSSGPADIGNLTASVLGETLSRLPRMDQPLWQAMTDQAVRLSRRSASAGNGGLMRTAIVGVCFPLDRHRTALVARRICALTHAAGPCVESAILWTEAVRRAAVDRVYDLESGLDLIPAESRTKWAAAIQEASQKEPAEFSNTGYTVTALQAAWSAVWSTRTLPAGNQFDAAIGSIVRAGGDTDTTAAIAGGLLGAMLGSRAIPRYEELQGWPCPPGTKAAAWLAEMEQRIVSRSSQEC
jgi:ADP-ribosylglycohydrolase